MEHTGETFACGAQALPSAMEHTAFGFAEACVSSVTASPCVSSVTPAEVPDNVDEFIDRCKQAEAGVVDETATALMVEVECAADGNANGKHLQGAQMDGDDKLRGRLRRFSVDSTARKLQMDKKKNIVLIEPDGTQTPITMRDTAFTLACDRTRGQ